MTHPLINGSTLFQAFNQGAKRVMDIRIELNDINVFPVADSDTGNNLASLMRSISSTNVNDNASVNTTLTLVADKAIEGAKGNSGMIFAQYFNGIASSYNNLEDSLEYLVESFHKAVDSAISAVQNPQEGTILTVMRIWATSLKESFDQSSWEESLIVARDSAYESLQKTSKQHVIMKKHGVVDAGAMGFYEFVDGMTDSFIGKTYVATKPLENVDEIETISHLENHGMDVPTFRYCMELTISDVNNPNQFQEVLKPYGDSLVVIHGQSHSRVHIHTDQPQDVIQALEPYGTINKTKADDMIQQYFDIYENKEKIAIVTDSIADLPKSLIEKFNIHVIPLTVLVDTTEHLDKTTISNTKLIELIRSEKHDISSSQVNQNVLFRMLEQLENRYEKVVVITVASAQSGSYNTIKNALRNYKGHLNIEVIDSKLNSLAQGILVKRAGEYVQNKVEWQTLVKQLRNDRKNIKIYVSVEDLDPIIKSGRIPQSLGKIAKRLGLKPIVVLDESGAGGLMSMGLTMKGNQKTIKKKVLKYKGQLEEIVLGYTSNPDTAHEWYDYFTNNNLKIDYVEETSSIVALSAGQGATAVAILIKGE